MQQPSEPFFDVERYKKKLAIVVPYRDRADHLSKFLAHMLMYFERDKLDRHLSVSINIVEQFGDKPFNRGKLNNAGFSLVKDSCDYVCFHDVDYLPLWADYSWSGTPARLIWFGLTLRQDWKNFFGAVNLFDNAAFVKTNGFPNCYWGWGHEDTELCYRCRAAGFEFEKRDGTFYPLAHRHAGILAPGLLTEEAQLTRAIFLQRQPRLAHLMFEDGLTNLNFDLHKKSPLIVEDKLVQGSWHFMVDIF